MSVTLHEKRLRALESTYGIGGGGGPGEACPECGGPDDGKPDPNDTYELIFVDPEDGDENEWCPLCGRQTRIVLEWGD